MKFYTYDDLRKLAIEQGIADNRVSIGIWIKIQGYLKKRRLKNRIITINYFKPDVL